MGKPTFVSYKHKILYIFSYRKWIEMTLPKGRRNKMSPRFLPYRGKKASCHRRALGQILASVGGKCFLCRAKRVDKEPGKIYLYKA